jgi:uncharacterized protein involved in exopolysaccharide biosynthesis
VSGRASLRCNFKTVDLAVAPYAESKTKHALIAIVATILGGILDAFVVVLIGFTRSRKENA